MTNQNDDPANPNVPSQPVEVGAPANTWRHALRLAAASEQYIAQLRAALGLSSNEMNAMLLLHDGGACTMTQLSSRISLSRPALTTLVDRLARQGWAERRPDPLDRRKVIVAVTGRFEQELMTHSLGWRDRLQKLAASSEAWDQTINRLADICDICATSAVELQVEVQPGQ
ncbi:MAG: transcriptional regulator, MarR family [Thermoleophilia bacterium]|nr:transcriptional regulator, MarR family [Thermoleophilia bacterium]